MSAKQGAQQSHRRKDELIKQLQKDISDKGKALEDLQEKYNQLNNSLKVQQDSYEKNKESPSRY